MRSLVISEFVRRCGRPPTRLARAPGRVNLIGEHTDYNEGFVLPAAIDRAVWIALRPIPEPKIELQSLAFDDPCALPLTGDLEHGTGWTEYVRGVAWSLQCQGIPLRGWQGVVASDLPAGAGLSSSAALELAVARAFVALANEPWDALAMARTARRAENDWVGVNCGIMDQLASAAGEAGHALLIDCRSLATRAVPLPEDVRIVVLDTATRRDLVDSAYNVRRVECERAAQVLGVSALRDVDAAEIERRAGTLDPVLRGRARHVTSENARTLRAAAALDQGDLETVGRLMNESHASLRDDFEVSRRELDVMAELAQRHPACLGARMTGAGFGGCVVALVNAEGVENFRREVEAGYRARVGLAPAVYACTPAAGASIEALVDS